MPSLLPGALSDPPQEPRALSLQHLPSPIGSGMDPQTSRCSPKLCSCPSGLVYTRQATAQGSVVWPGSDQQGNPGHAQEEDKRRAPHNLREAPPHPTTPHLPFPGGDDSS